MFNNEYIIVGSTNINERSFNGNRDTEITFDVNQAHLLCDSNIKLFRLTSQAKHCGTL